MCEARAAALALGLTLGAVSAGPGQAEVCIDGAGIDTGAAYIDQSRAYDHGAVADGEWAHLRYSAGGKPVTVAPPEGIVFEGPRPLRLPCGDALFAVESSLTKGSRVVRFDATGRSAAISDWIGRPHRWISLVGVMPAPKSGVNSPTQHNLLAIDRPHLLGDLLIFETQGKAPGPGRVLYRGVSNHRLGAADTVGGMRTCPGEPTAVVLATLDWSAVLRLNFDREGRSIGAATRFEGTGPASFAAAMACD